MSDIEHLFMCLLAICMSSSEKYKEEMTVYFFGQFFDWVVYFSGIELHELLFEINSLSVASLAVIFSHSEGCLFTLLIVYFIKVQKLLSLIRSHLFIFVFIPITLGGGS